MLMYGKINIVKEKKKEKKDSGMEQLHCIVGV